MNECRRKSLCASPSTGKNAKTTAACKQRLIASSLVVKLKLRFEQVHPPAPHRLDRRPHLRQSSHRGESLFRLRNRGPGPQSESERVSLERALLDRFPHPRLFAAPPASGAEARLMRCRLSGPPAPRP